VVAQDVGIGSEPAQLGHRGDQGVVRQLALPAGFHLPGHEIASHDFERRRPAPDSQSVTLAEGLEEVVIADRMAVVFGLMPDEVDAETRLLEARQSPIVVDRDVADRADRQLDMGRRRLTVWESTTPAERGVGARGRGSALEAG
jgi:hypothetical protein